MNYGFLDGGFYTVSRIMPSEKYFCGLNIKNSDIDESQNTYVKNGVVDFVVTKDIQPDSDLFDKYECITQAPLETAKGQVNVYYLYRKKGV